MSEIEIMAATVCQVLVPYLAEFFRSASEECGKSIPGFIATKWEAIRNRLAARPAGVELIDDLSRAPGDPDLHASLRVQIRKLLESDPEFSSLMAELLATPEVRDEFHEFHASLNGQGAIAQGSGSTAIGAVNVFSHAIAGGFDFREQTRELTTEEVEFFLTISKPRNQGSISIEFLEKRTDRENARYLEMANGFIEAGLMRYDYPLAKFTRPGWDLADELWERRILRAIMELQKPPEHGVDALIVATRVGLHEDESDNQEFDRLTVKMKDKGLIDTAETLSDCSLLLTAEGATVARAIK